MKVIRMISHNKQLNASSLILFLLICLVIVPAVAADQSNNNGNDQSIGNAVENVKEISLSQNIQNEISDQIALREIIERAIAERERTLSEHSLLIDDSNDISDDLKGLRIQSSANNAMFTLTADSGNEIPLGGYIQFSLDGKTRVFSSEGKQLYYAIDSDVEQVRVPSGEEIPITHLIPIRSGASIHIVGNKEYVVYKDKVIIIIIDQTIQNKNKLSLKAPTQKDSKSWVEWGESDSYPSIGEFVAKWKIPLSPNLPSEGENNILFNGIQPEDGSMIFQPVTAFNYFEHSKVGNSIIWRNKWTGAAWYGVNHIYHISQPIISFSETDVAQGSIIWLSDTSQYLILLQNLDQNTETRIYTDTMWLYPNQLQALVTYEAWPYYPIQFKDVWNVGDTRFYGMYAKDINNKRIPLKWNPKYNYDGHPLINGLFVDTSNGPSKVTLYTDKSYTITPITGAHGSITPSEPQKIAAGGSQTFTISPDQGYVVEDVKINKESIGAVTSYTFNNVDKDSTIRATFKRQPTYTITPNAGSHGTISPSTQQKVVAGGSQIFAISANTGYVISDVLVDGASVGSVKSYTFENVQANHRIRATFKSSPSTFTILSKAGSGGSISPSGSVTVPAGRSQTFTITSNSGYMVADVFVDGLSQGAISSYTFLPVTADHTISATFKPVSVPGTEWIWSRDGWGDWQHIATWGGPEVGENSEYGPVMVNDPIEGLYGEHGTITHLNRGWIEASVWRTFTVPSGSGWNTITFNGALAASSVPQGRWMTIEVNGQQVFWATTEQTPPGNTGGPFEITASFPKTQTATVRISQGQNPAWGPLFWMKFYSVKLSNENTVMMKTESVPFVITDGKGLVTNGTAPQ